MNFLGFGPSTSSNLQAQIDAINAQITTINGLITTLQTNVTTLQTQTSKLSDSASGNFASFIFTGNSITNLNASMSPVYGNGFAIPFSDMTAGMSIHVTLFAALQVAATIPNTQTLQLFLAQDNLGNSQYTNPTAIGVLDTSTVSVIWEFWINVKALSGPQAAIGISKHPSPAGGAGGLVVIFTSSINPFSPGGCPIFLIGRWGGAGGTQNLGIYDIVIERQALF
jgi:hypothetical protein